MKSDIEIGKRIRFLRVDVLGLRSQEAFADRLGGVTRGAVGNWELGKGIKTENLRRIAETFDVSLDWLATSKGSAPEARNDSPKAKVVRRGARANLDKDVQRIPDLNIFGGMGDGGLLDVEANSVGEIVDGEHLRGYWTFPGYMVRSLRNLKHIYAWEVRGDSMEPTLPGGSVVFVDTSQKHPPPDDIYAIDYGDGLMVKRLKLIPRSDEMAVISDNDRYGTDALPRNDVRVYGRIVGWFQWRG